MEKNILKQLQSMLPQIITLSKNKKSVWFDYDKGADTLYVSFAKPQKTTDTDMISDDILVRKKNEEIVGVTILHASSF